MNLEMSEEYPTSIDPSIVNPALGNESLLDATLRAAANGSLEES